MYILNGYSHGLRTFRWLNQFLTYRGEVEANPCGWKVLASYISKAPWRETSTILSFFDNILPLLKICSFSENYPCKAQKHIHVKNAKCKRIFRYHRTIIIRHSLLLMGYYITSNQDCQWRCIISTTSFWTSILATNDVEDCFFEDFMAIFPLDHCIQDLTDYGFENYILPTGKFPPHLWAIFSLTIIRITNAYEAFHYWVSGMFHHPHPSIFHLINALLETKIYHIWKCKAAAGLLDKCMTRWNLYRKQWKNIEIML